jgi:uncharacterized damage-inducible protein DinB
MSTQPEPWLRGPMTGVPPVTAPVLYAIEQAREDLRKWTERLSDADLWAAPVAGIAPVGFQIKHIAGSIERLLAYLGGEQLSAEQLAELEREHEPVAREQMFARLEASFDLLRSAASEIDARTWDDRRTVGRKRLPTTAGGLLIHIAEHTQRHVGEAIVTCKLVEAMKSRPAQSLE